MPNYSGEAFGDRLPTTVAYGSVANFKDYYVPNLTSSGLKLPCTFAPAAAYHLDGSAYTDSTVAQVVTQVAALKALGLDAIPALTQVMPVEGSWNDAGVSGTWTNSTHLANILTYLQALSACNTGSTLPRRIMLDIEPYWAAGDRYFSSGNRATVATAWSSILAYLLANFDQVWVAPGGNQNSGGTDNGHTYQMNVILKNYGIPIVECDETVYNVGYAGKGGWQASTRLTKQYTEALSGSPKYAPGFYPNVLKKNAQGPLSEVVRQGNAYAWVYLYALTGYSTFGSTAWYTS